MKNILILLMMTFVLLPFALSNPIVTAISYDPAGSDGGHEWIELFNPKSYSINLTNYSLHKGNGANEDDWTMVWSNSSFEMMPLSFYTLGEREIALSDELTTLGLQNGPDALRLVFGNESLETIGWGDHSYGEYYDGDPTDDIASSVLVRNFTVRGNDIIFDYTKNNKADFYFERDREPRNHYFSLSQLLLPSDSVSEVTYVFTIENQLPVMTGAELLLVDVSGEHGHQVVVPEDSQILFRVFLNDGNGFDDIVKVNYELQLAGNSFLSGEIVLFQNKTNQSIDIQIPFLSSYPAGSYTVLLTAVDSQDGESQTAGLQFETQYVLGVSVLDAVLLFEASTDARNFSTTVTLENTGNIDSRLEFMFQSTSELDVFYFSDGVKLRDAELSLLRSGENVTIDVTIIPRSQMRAGRYTGLFRVVTYEATV